MLSKSALDAIKEADKFSDKPLSDAVIRELASVSGENPNDLIRDFHENREIGDPMPVVIG